MDKRKRVRFGCTLAPDVADILNEHARCSLPALKDPAGDICVTCNRPLVSRYHQPDIDGNLLPTRTEILEAGARLYAQSLVGTVERSSGRQPASQIDTRSDAGPDTSLVPDRIETADQLTKYAQPPQRKAARKTRKQEADEIRNRGQRPKDNTGTETVLLGADSVPALAAEEDVVETVSEALPDMRGVVYGTTEQTAACLHPARERRGKKCLACGVSL